MKLIEVIDKLKYRHPSLNEIYDKVKSEFPTMSFSTLYSNLLTLRKLNLVKFFSLEGETRLEVNTSPHINVIHSSLREIEDYVDEELIRKIEERVGKRVRLINVFVEE